MESSLADDSEKVIAWYYISTEPNLVHRIIIFAPNIADMTYKNFVVNYMNDKHKEKISFVVAKNKTKNNGFY